MPNCSGWKSAGPEVRHWNSKIDSPIGKLCQNLHIGNMVVVEAKQHGFETRAKHSCLLAVWCPFDAVSQEIQRPCVLQ